MSEQKPEAQGFVVGGSPASELQRLREILKMPPAEREQALATRSRDAQAKAEAFAERQVAALVNEVSGSRSR